MNNDNPLVNWRPHLALGITGHRPDHPDYAANEAAVKATLLAIFDEIEAIRGQYENPGAEAVRLHNLLARGVDEVAAEHALAKGWKLVAPLPFGAELNLVINSAASTREDMVALCEGREPVDPEVAARAGAIRSLMDSATAFEIADRDAEIRDLMFTAFERPGDEKVTHRLQALQSENVALAGRIMLERSDLLIAVWDRKRADMAGGTGHTVISALEIGTPVLVIDVADPRGWSILTRPEELGHEAADNRDQPDHARLRAIVEAAFAPIDPAMERESWQPRSGFGVYRRIEQLFGGRSPRTGTTRAEYEAPDAIAEGSAAPLLATAKKVLGAGDAAYAKALDLYFERHDGRAVTCDDFVAAMDDVSGIALTQFKRWYSQAGTPRVKVAGQYDAAAKCYSLTIAQSTPITTSQPTKMPLHMPINVSLLGADGTMLVTACEGNLAAEHVLHLTQAEQVFTFTDVTQNPIPSLLRGFSAPVKLEYDYSAQELLLLLSSDSDGFSRWSAAQQLAVNELTQLIEQAKAGQELAIESQLIGGFKQLLTDKTLDKSMVALILTLPSQAYLSELATEIDPQAIKQARHYLKTSIARELEQELLECYQANQTNVAYVANAEQIAQRQLKNAALSYWAETGSVQVQAVLAEQYKTANNMTDQYAALSIAVHSGHPQADSLLERFYQQWSHEALVVNKWLMLSAGQERTDGLECIQQLMQHESFDLKNPNKVRAVLGGLGQSVASFHQESGAGYRFLADQIILLNKRNPQLASRLCTPLTRWQKMKPQLSQLMNNELQRILQEDLSKDVYEVVSKSLA